MPLNLRDADAEQVLSRLARDLVRKKARKDDLTRAELKTKKDATEQELALGVEALQCAIRDADARLAEAKTEMQKAARAKALAMRELDNFRRPLERKIVRLSVQIEQLQIPGIASLRQKLVNARYFHGASPGPFLNEKNNVDLAWLAWYRVEERFGEIDAWITKLEKSGDSIRVEGACPVVETEIDRAAR